MSDCAPQRVDGLIESRTGNELIIYAEQTRSIHLLNQTGAKILNLCDGVTTIETIGAATGLPTSEVRSFLADLNAIELIVGNWSPLEATGLSRREAMKKLGMAAAVALPTVVSISTPAAADVSSCTRVLEASDPCNPSKNCCGYVGTLQMVCGHIGFGTYTCQS